MRCLSLILILLACGCTSTAPRQSAAPSDNYPPDFALALLVEQDDERWLYLIEPDRTLRAASGQGVGLDTYPPRTAKLTPRQMAEVYRLTRLAFTPQDAAAPGDTYSPGQFQIVIRGALPPGMLHNLRGPIFPPIRNLLAYLTTLRGG